MGIVKACVLFLRAMFAPKIHLTVENVGKHDQRMENS